jgi:hypothetical protein
MDLPMQFKNALAQLGQILTEEQQTTAANVLWCIWKAQNEEVFEGKMVNPVKVIKQVRAMEFVIV